MKKSPEHPSPALGDLFQQAMEGVTPIAPSNRIIPTPPAPNFKARGTLHSASDITDSFSDHGASDIAPTSFVRVGLNQMTLRKLRRGYWPVQDTMDLHGHTSEEARLTLFKFLQHALHNGFRCVNVIHGKGWRAEGGEGILKIRVRHWLSQFPQVMAFCEPPDYAGGAGAVWVLLKSSSE